MLADIFLVLFLPAGLLPPPHLLPVFVFHCPIIFASPYSKVLPKLAYGNIGFPRLFLFLSFSLNSLHSISCSLMYFHVRLSLIHSSQRYTAPALYYALVGHRHNAILLVCAQRLSLKIFFFNDTATTEIYTLSLHDALPIFFSNSAVDMTSCFVSTFREAKSSP